MVLCCSAGATTHGHTYTQRRASACMEKPSMLHPQIVIDLLKYVRVCARARAHVHACSCASQALTEWSSLQPRLHLSVCVNSVFYHAYGHKVRVYVFYCVRHNLCICMRSARDPRHTLNISSLREWTRKQQHSSRRRVITAVSPSYGRVFSSALSFSLSAAAMARCKWHKNTHTHHLTRMLYGMRIQRQNTHTIECQRTIMLSTRYACVYARPFSLSLSRMCSGALRSSTSMLNAAPTASTASASHGCCEFSSSRVASRIVSPTARSPTGSSRAHQSVLFWHRSATPTPYHSTRPAATIDISLWAPSHTLLHK